MPRLIRIAGSFAIVLVSYFAYALVAVPLIEPTVEVGRAEKISELDRKAVQEQLDQRVDALRELFPPGAWELNNPKILESDRFKLLMQDYRNLGDGRVELRPCTVILMPEESIADPKQRNRQAVVLQAPEGAMLEFDGPFDLRSAKIGRLIGGRLNGRITIRSGGKNPGPEDDLLIVTKNVELTERHVWTPHEVDFRLGPNYGHGRQMHIKLLLGEKTSKSDQRGLNIAGVELFEIKHVERLHLEMGETGSKAPRLRRGDAKPQAAELPVEITCRGPFRFDVPGKVATFEDRVNVMRVHPVGPVDQLSCELLSIFFVDRKASSETEKPDEVESKTAKPAGSLGLQPQRIEARGNPVVLNAPSEKLHARGERLEYDMLQRRIALEGGNAVMLRHGANEIHAKSLHYHSVGPGRLGRVAAEGPGRIRGQMADRPDEQLTANWNEMLRVYPHQQNQVISLTGTAGLEYGAIGRLDAEEIHFWLLESPMPEDDKPQLRPDRMLAKNNVRLSSPQLSGAVEQLEVWFEGKGKGPEARGQGPGVSKKGEGGKGKAEGLEHQPPTADSQSPIAKQHFEIVGRLLQAKVLLGENEQAKLSELIVEDGVRFVETQTAAPDERPMLLVGDRLHLLDASQSHAAVSITGRPAHFEGRGLGLTGANINLNRGTNRLWIDGPGRMKLPLDRDLEGQPLKKPGKLDVQWRRRMVFDGRTARFEDSVTAEAATGELQTETMEVQLQRSVRFDDAKIDEQPQVEQILCRGGVLMESRTFDGDTPLSFERMQVVDLAINLISGATTAGGPGWLNSVRRGSDGLASGRGTPVADTASNTKDDDQLKCLHVRFQGSITGDLHRREMTFHDQVQTTYATVESWMAMLDVGDPEELGPDGVVMHCDQLSVTQTATPAGDRKSLELEAAGNTVVEGNTFTARAIRMTYAEAKDLLVLEGDGRTDAELFRQQKLGGSMSKATARKIMYYPKTNRLKVAGARSLELGNLQSFGGSQ